MVGNLKERGRRRVDTQINREGILRQTDSPILRDVKPVSQRACHGVANRRKAEGSRDQDDRSPLTFETTFCFLECKAALSPLCSERVFVSRMHRKMWCLVGRSGPLAMGLCFRKGSTVANTIKQLRESWFAEFRKVRNVKMHGMKNNLHKVRNRHRSVKYTAKVILRIIGQKVQKTVAVSEVLGKGKKGSEN